MTISAYYIFTCFQICRQNFFLFHRSQHWHTFIRRTRHYTSRKHFSWRLRLQIQTPKEVSLKNFAIFTEKRLCWSLFLNKFAGLRACNFIKKRLQHRCSPVNHCKIFQNICERQLLRLACHKSLTFNMKIYKYTEISFTSRNSCY